ncbi:retron system putative HNH endonuclease [Mitsuaria sp. GD03876]|uniref:retron system putative HNH endonuclease n=1 Tax=Mitsuaria sp. GD03876 TaxID=2975399 RepID=UPI00244B2C09|nr:retron system putative HNH endonuclease [Mitsuaria sp. GD03876]MDH0865875.1 TIGR02646 family protein [Mitsuaria sp. GD03876]
MRYIAKRQSPHEFERWRTDGKADGWSPRYRDLGGEDKRNLLRALLEEQAHLCCYCGSVIGEADSHIEHFRPQSRFEQLDLDYSNLHASCVRTPKGMRPTWHCGHAKENDFCEERFIAPTEEDCEQRFIYALSGAVYATDPVDPGARYMSKLLGLDVEVLRERRREALEEVFNDEFVRSTNEEQLRQYADSWRAAGSDGRARKFGHVLARHAEQMIEDMRRASP